MKRFAVALMVALAIPTFALAQAEVQSGFTSVALDTATLSSAAGLTLSSVSPGIGAGTLPGSVAFPINARDAATLPTTFTYTPNDFPAGPFSGSIEHTGSVFFNADAVEVGNFTIGFDAARAVGAASGFYVESTTGVAAILFDTAVVALGEASGSKLDLTVDLLVSPEFATFLGDTALTGADVGDARILAAIPEPTSLSLLGLLSGIACLTRRVRS
jgi:hypothetical protein